MWAQIIKMHLRPGKEGELESVVEHISATEQPGSGLLRSTAMRDQNDPRSVYMMVVFESEEKARAREQDPRRQEGLQAARAKMAEVFEGPPEFVDLNVVGEITPATSGGKDTTAAKNKVVFRRLMEECFDQGNLNLIEEFVSPDWVNIDPSLPEELHGHEGIRQLITMWRNGFPDFHIAIEDMVAEGDKVAARFRFTGTHQGEFVGIPPTGRQVRGTGTGIIRFVDGKDVEHRVNFDALGVMQQLGIIPAPEQATT